MAPAMTAPVCVCGHLAVLHVPHGREHTGRCTGPCDCPAYTAAVLRCDRSPDPTLCCQFVAGHSGMHHAEGHWWGGVRRALTTAGDLRPLIEGEPAQQPAGPDVDTAAIRAEWSDEDESPRLGRAGQQILALCDALDARDAEIRELRAAHARALRDREAVEAEMDARWAERNARILAVCDQRDDARGLAAALEAGLAEVRALCDEHTVDGPGFYESIDPARLLAILDHASEEPAHWVTPACAAAASSLHVPHGRGDTRGSCTGGCGTCTRYQASAGGVNAAPPVVPAMDGHDDPSTGHTFPAPGPSRTSAAGGPPDTVYLDAVRAAWPDDDAVREHADLAWSQIHELADRLAERIWPDVKHQFWPGVSATGVTICRAPGCQRLENHYLHQAEVARA